MCGLTGFIDFSGKSDLTVLKAMAETIKHRGPDDEGYEMIEHSAALIGFGFKRLSILDLSPAGHQPMKNPDTGDLIIFNGEIYNFREIRKELESLGYSFKTSGDTEVILRSYQQWGTKCVDRFIGMFAIVLHDVKNNKIVCFRDRAGVKPFFYYWDNGVFLFSSELKAFHKHPAFLKKIDNDALALFFQYGYIPAPHSIFQNTFKLLPGRYLEINLLNKEISITKYWDVIDAYNAPRISISFKDALSETEKLLTSAFNYRMIADVPVGVFLSGGYDSSCVTAILQKSNTNKIKTYTIGFEEEAFNEADHAKSVASFLGTDHHEYYCTFKEAIDLVPQLPDIYDEPFGDQSSIPTTLVSKIARRHVTVALSADGGDEIFAGYPRHLKSLAMMNKLSRFPRALAPVVGAVNRLNQGSSLEKPNRINKLHRALKSNNEAELFGVINESFTPAEIKKLLIPTHGKKHTGFDDGALFNNNNDTLSKVLGTEYRTYLVDDILQKVDRATMSVSLEGREPFLDHRIIEFVAQLPSDFKMKDGKQKILLKELVHKFIPEKIMNRPKMGFGIPMNRWCRNELKDLFIETLAYDKVKEGGIMNPTIVENMYKTYLANDHEDFQRIWYIFVFQQWYNRWMN